MNNILLLASKSQSRQKLLRDSRIPFSIIEQEADESKCDWGLPLEQVVQSIARFKMEHAIIPIGKEGEICFVLTADTLSQDLDGTINGKPVDRDDAIAMIKRARGGSRLCTAFCLEKKICEKDTWKTIDKIEHCVSAEYIFAIPDQWIERYLEIMPVLTVSNAIAIEEFGEQFLKVVHGSYSAIIGLPIYELREALEKLDFFK